MDRAREVSEMCESILSKSRAKQPAVPLDLNDLIAAGDESFSELAAPSAGLNRASPPRI